MSAITTKFSSSHTTQGINMNQLNSLYHQLGGQQGVANIVSSFYDNMLDDYRIARFFNSTEIEEQKSSLVSLLSALCGVVTVTDEEKEELMDNFFLNAFARSKRKSFIAGSDFGFFGMVIEQDRPSDRKLCDTHMHLLKFMPEDFQYDAVVESLKSAMQTQNLSADLIDDAVAALESARNPILGK
jgi:hypothetical protein